MTPLVRGRTLAPAPRQCSARASQGENRSVADPEARFRRYGTDFGKKGYVVQDDTWSKFAPRRFKGNGDRAKDQFGELAVLNERLAGNEAWQIRRRVEYLKRKREVWEGVYQTVGQDDVALTLNTLEKAINDVEAALSDENQEVTAISDLKAELLGLQKQVETAHERLHVTQGRVELNVARLTELKSEARSLERVNRAAADSVLASQSGHPEVVEHLDALRAASATLASQAASNAAVGAAAAAPVAAAAAAAAPAAAAVGGIKAAQPIARGGVTKGPASVQPSTTRRTTKKAVGLSSTMTIDRGLRNFWYPVAFTSKLKEDTLVPMELFNETWVLFRDETGAAACVYDQCAHRACPLSLGSVEQGQISCPYHGWQFNGAGECTHMPSTVMCKGVKVAHLPTVEADGWVWVWGGDAEPVEIPRTTLPPSNFVLHSEIEVEVPVDHGLLMENLLDLAHAPFTHTGTFAKGWPVPKVVRFHTSRILAGAWDPYPIDMSFEPPCMVVSQIGLKQPGQIESGAKSGDCDKHLHQLHVCLPSKTGHTRLLYRMSLDFMGWVQYVPGIQLFWKYIAGQVLGEDLVLVNGQQERLKSGGDTWSHPVSYDKLAVRYRRWRNDVAQHIVPAPEHYQSSVMDSGDMFLFDKEDELLGCNEDSECALPTGDMGPPPSGGPPSRSAP